MRSVKSVVGLFLITFLSTVDAKASCPSIWAQSAGGSYWYEFDVDSSCVTVSGATAGGVSCLTGYSFNSGFSEYLQWTFVIPADGTAINNGQYFNQLSTNYSVSVWVDFNSPEQTYNDTLSGTYTVTHNGSNSGSTFFSLAGNTSSTQSCGRFDGSFSATNGDTITVRIDASNWGRGSTVHTSLPVVFNNP